MKYAIFDIDGTLVDSMPVWNNMCIDVLNKYGVSYPENILDIITPLGMKQGAKYLIKLGLNLTVDEIIQIELDYAIKQYRESVPLKKGVKKYLKSLKEDGVKMCVLTASSHDLIDPCLKRLGIWEYFEYIVSAEDIGVSKSDTRAFEIMLEKLGAEPHETVVFDDNFSALKAAKRAGLKTCGVYDKASEINTEKIKKMCDMYIESF